MKIFVSVKMVPDVTAPMQIKNGELILDVDRTVLNAYDASGVEEALVLQEAHGGEVVVVSVGPAKAAETLRKALAMGADSAVHISTEGHEGANGLDSLVTLRFWQVFMETSNMMRSFLANNLKIQTPDSPEAWWPNYWGCPTYPMRSALLGKRMAGFW